MKRVIFSFEVDSDDAVFAHRLLVSEFNSSVDVFNYLRSRTDDMCDFHVEDIEE